MTTNTEQGGGGGGGINFSNFEDFMKEFSSEPSPILMKSTEDMYSPGGIFHYSSESKKKSKKPSHFRMVTKSDSKIK